MSTFFKTGARWIRMNLKEAEKKRTAQRSSAQSRVSNAVTEAISAPDLGIDVNDIVATVGQAIKTTKTAMKRGIVVFDAKSINKKECEHLAIVMA